ncbi:MAG TPA: glycosyltransferase family 2 protein [Candidatus Acidoferrales bacterium]|jgi:glycosyltransferase involved in cell wall biosynthesis|nr:glycosyltransferase family 2 protein [Candidatus Acidoferrales bacterium]
MPERFAVIIPALNEEAAIGPALDALLGIVCHPESAAADEGSLNSQVIVVDNGSTDRTAQVARAHGAQVVHEPHRGYGSACLAGMAALAPDVTVVAFMDGDGSDDPADLPRLLEPIVRGEADMVLGSRVLGERETGALTPQQRFGNALAAVLLRVLHGARYTDLGPFRAIRRDALERLGMRDTSFGWTVEMQIKAARHGLRVLEIPVHYRKRRAGQSKISGTLRGTISAGAKITWTIFRYSFGGGK